MYERLRDYLIALDEISASSRKPSNISFVMRHDADRRCVTLRIQITTESDGDSVTTVIPLGFDLLPVGRA